MTLTSTIQTLNDLLHILCRSLPAYLVDAKPWASSGNQQVCKILDRLGADQQRYARRVERAIIDLGGRPDPGCFPKSFAAKNDLSVEYLRQEVIAQLEQDIAAIEVCAAQLSNTALFHALAEEILGNAKGHLEIFKEE
jgi:hypothetical protein